LQLAFSPCRQIVPDFGSRTFSHSTARLASLAMALAFPLLALLLFTSPARAQSYQIDWFTTSGGGGTSSGGNYSVSGTIGQPAAGPLAGGAYTLEGGFWGISETGPKLRIRRFGADSVLVSWPKLSTGFQLQQSPWPESSAPWGYVPDVPVTVGEEQQIILPASSGNHFFRLIKP
jgi:hypothetical protein